MITDKDIAKLIEAYKKEYKKTFPTKADFTKGFEELSKDINNLRAYIEDCAVDIKKS